MNKCTNCNKQFKDLRVRIELILGTKTIRKSHEELVENSKILNKEFLCTDCFEKFSSILENFSKEE